MIINDINKGPAIESVIGSKEFFGSLSCGMKICKCINGPMQCDTFLYSWGIVKFFPAFYKITDKVANQYLWFVK